MILIMNLFINKSNKYVFHTYLILIPTIFMYVCSKQKNLLDIKDFSRYGL